MLLALLLAASGAALVPASADGALVLDGPFGVTGLRALLSTAARSTATLSPETLGRSLRDSVGVDLFAEQPEWGLAKRGPRALVLSRGTLGLSAPVAEPKSARRALDAWRASGNRAGKIATVAGSRRLLVASGPQAAALVKALAKPGTLTRDKALLARATGPAWVYLKGRPPLRAAIFALEASATGLVARGLVTPVRDPILAGPAPGPCDGAPPGCLRAALGPSGRAVLAAVLAGLQQKLPEAQSVRVRLEGIDAQRLGDDRSLPRALRITVAGAPAEPAGPSLDGRLDLTAIAAALARLTPIDALHGSLAAGAYAANLVWGPLLRNAGPLTLGGTPAKSGAEIEIRLPLRQGPE